MNSVHPGKVYLIGAGPGDPGLLTLRGAEILKAADVIVYDRLAHPRLLNLAGASAEHVYVGKASANHAMKQGEINELLVDRALAGLVVARLKGGDPFVFGRGGEEAEYCALHGVKFEVVPGVTSAIAAAAYAGIPVTHRDAASSFAVITGHERDDNPNNNSAGAAEGRRNWKNIAWAADTLVFLMGIENLTEITNRLMEHGRTPETPVGLVQWGTWSSQKVVTGKLNNIVHLAKTEGIASPAICIVGEVVGLRERLRWFDDPAQRPLLGKRILVTRAREQASSFCDMLRSLGADPVEFPTIRVLPRASNPELESAIVSLKDYCWLVFTSANAVNVVADSLREMGVDSRALGSSKVAAIGPATAEALVARLNVSADYTPNESVSEAVLRDWPDTSMGGKRVLIPCAAGARDILPNGLRELGATVDVIAVYDTVLDTEGAADLRSRLEEGSLDVLTFTSSSTVDNFVQAIGSPDSVELMSLIGKCSLAAIGPITAQTMRGYGLEPAIMPSEHTIQGLVAELTSFFHESPNY